MTLFTVPRVVPFTTALQARLDGACPRAESCLSVSFDISLALCSVCLLPVRFFFTLRLSSDGQAFLFGSIVNFNYP